MLFLAVTLSRSGSIKPVNIILVPHQVWERFQRLQWFFSLNSFYLKDWLTFQQKISHWPISLCFSCELLWATRLRLQSQLPTRSRLAARSLKQSWRGRR
jgi:hypothetical protein